MGTVVRYSQAFKQQVVLELEQELSRDTQRLPSSGRPLPVDFPEGTPNQSRGLPEGTPN